MSVESRIEKKCREIAFLRAQGRCQIMCGKKATERHHIFDGKWRNYWQLWADDNFHVVLCHGCHHVESFSPHKKRLQFFALLENGLKRQRLNDLWEIIKRKDDDVYRNSGKFLREAKSALEPDLDKIYKWLVHKHKNLEETNWMDIECQEVINK